MNMINALNLDYNETSWFYEGKTYNIDTTKKELTQLCNLKAQTQPIIIQQTTDTTDRGIICSYMILNPQTNIWCWFISSIKNDDDKELIGGLPGKKSQAIVVLENYINNNPDIAIFKPTDASKQIKLISGELQFVKLQNLHDP